MAKLPCHETASVIQMRPSILIDPVQNWDATFRDQEIEERYFLDWWLPACEATLAHSLPVLLISGSMILIANIIQPDGRYALVTQMTMAASLSLVIGISWSQRIPCLQVKRAWVGSFLMTASFVVPLIFVWVVTTLFEAGYMNSGWCGSDYARDLCEGARNNTMPREYALTIVVSAFSACIYCRPRWLHLVLSLVILAAIFQFTLSRSFGSGVGSISFALMGVATCARSLETWHRKCFIANQHLIMQSNLISRYSEALLHQGEASGGFNGYGKGMGTGEQTLEDRYSLCSCIPMAAPI